MKQHLNPRSQKLFNVHAVHQYLGVIVYQLSSTCNECMNKPALNFIETSLGLCIRQSQS
jgi:hypothetical protein